MDKKVLLNKLNKFCPDWIHKPDYDLALPEMLQHVIQQVLPGLLHIKIEHVDKHKIVGSVPYRNETGNVVGYMHGGTIFTAGDTLAGTFIWANTPGDVYAVTSKAEIKYLKPFEKGTLKCTVTEKSKADRKITLEASFKDSHEQDIALMTIDYLLMQAPKNS